MSLRFYNRGGRRISHAEWAALIRTPGYGDVYRSQHAGCHIETAWVGVAASWERHAKIFVVVVGLDAAAAQEVGGYAEKAFWFAEETVAAVHHEHLVIHPHVRDEIVSRLKARAERGSGGSGNGRRTRRRTG